MLDVPFKEACFTYDVVVIFKKWRPLILSRNFKSYTIFKQILSPETSIKLLTPTACRYVRRSNNFVWNHICTYVKLKWKVLKCFCGQKLNKNVVFFTIFFETIYKGCFNNIMANVANWNESKAITASLYPWWLRLQRTSLSFQTYFFQFQNKFLCLSWDCCLEQVIMHIYIYFFSIKCKKILQKLSLTKKACLHKYNGVSKPYSLLLNIFNFCKYLFHNLNNFSVTAGRCYVIWTCDPLSLWGFKGYIMSNALLKQLIWINEF